MVSGLIATAVSTLKKCDPIKPPIITPKTTTKFHYCDFHSKLKKSVLLSAPQIVHIGRRFDKKKKKVVI